jgi:lysophospholipase L1-like esterase
MYICFASLIYNGLTVQANPLVKSGDRVVFLGGTFVERMQNYGHLEQEIASRVSNVTFRNLGWSGDNVWGESRAVFGTVAQGFERLQRDMALAQPSVIIVSYGANEAHAGLAGLDRFVAGYQTLLDALKSPDTVIVLLTPRYYENLGSPLPDPTAYNAKLRLYIDAVDSLAAAQNLPIIHLSPRGIAAKPTVEKELQPKSWRVLPDHAGLTNDGIHVTSVGYQFLARLIADGLALPKTIFSVVEKHGTNVGIANYAATADNVSFVMTPKRIGAVDLATDGRNNRADSRQLRLRFSNLRPGKYGIYIDETQVLRASASQLKAGVSMSTSFLQSAISQTYQLTAEKNMMFFHRHRPQNETYLFLFRKHEQGNNAVEVPQYDPIVDGYEKRIQTIRSSSSYRVEIRRS